MELEVTQENLARALTIVGRVASSRTGLPVLGNILFRTQGSRLLVAATNLEIATTYYVGAKITSQGSVTLPARLVTEFVNNLPKATIKLTVKGTRMEIISGTYRSVVNGVDADEFPELPSIDETESIHYSIAASDFKHAVSQTIIACSNDTTRPVLTGVYWHSVEGFLYLAATDGYRLAERKLVATKSQIAAIVPASSLQEVLRTLTDGIDEVEVVFDNTQVRFRVGEAEVTSRLIDGSYPDYRQLIPKTSDTVLKLGANEFARIVKISSLFARESGGGITLNASAEDKQLSIHSIASELGENTSTAAADVTTEGVITLNSRYVSEALSVIDGDQIEFRFSGKLSPSVITTVEKSPNYLHIIMPLKT
ncbi:MAG: DNA polymerase III subunit beta [Candidatus Saccharimonas sp.]|nr:DNA polymerase III subunit beta [Candidatus Saccharimonas sp.]